MQEETGSLSVLGETVEVSASGVQEGVSGGGGGGENDGVDDGWKDRDRGTLDGNDPWRGSRTGVIVLLGREQVLVVEWNKHAEEESTEDIEEEDTPEDTLDGLWDVLARVLSLTGSTGDRLDTTEGEGSVDEGGEETEEAAFVAGTKVLVHRTGVLPVSESDAVMGRAATEVDD